jgi:ribose 5-phosphate isomerase
VVCVPGGGLRHRVPRRSQHLLDPRQTLVQAITGVVDHGIFAGFADRAMVVDPDGTVRTLTRD